MQERRARRSGIFLLESSAHEGEIERFVGFFKNPEELAYG
jgi:hypothetical protein